MWKLNSDFNKQYYIRTKFHEARQGIKKQRDLEKFPFLEPYMSNAMIEVELLRPNVFH